MPPVPARSPEPVETAAIATAAEDDRFDAFRVAAALDRIIWEEEETFPARDAAYLRRVVPRHRRRRFSLLGRFSGPGGATEGFAAGHGNVSMEDAETHKSFSVGGDRITRVGQYKLVHDAEALEIRQVMNDEWDDDQRCGRLLFDPLDRPKALELLHPVDMALPLPFLRIVVRKLTWRPWKLPA